MLWIEKNKWKHSKSEHSLYSIVKPCIGFTLRKSMSELCAKFNIDYVLIVSICTLFYDTLWIGFYRYCGADDEKQPITFIYIEWSNQLGVCKIRHMVQIYITKECEQSICGNASDASKQSIWHPTKNIGKRSKNNICEKWRFSLS